jgi:hypothetical protein
MIKPRHRLIDGCDRGNIQGRRPLQQYDGETQCSRRSDFAVRRCPTTVLRDDDVDLMLAQQIEFPVFAEGSAFKDVTRVRYLQWRIHRIDAANQVTVLRRRSKRRDLLTADCEKHAAGIGSQSTCCLPGVMYIGPSIAGDSAPWRPTQGKEGRASLRGGTLRMSRHRRGIRMRGIDQRVDLMVAQVPYEASRSAETARSYRHGLRQWRGRATGQGQSNRPIVTNRELLAEQSRLRRTAQNEDVCSHVAR